MKKAIILGATGSIGQSALNIARGHKDKLEICGLHAHRSAAALETLAKEFPSAKTALSQTNTRFKASWQGNNAIEELLKNTEADIVLNGIAGSAGLMPSIWSLENNKDLALANKESLVMAGPLLRALAAQQKRAIIPVDSEHSALFFLLQNRPAQHIKELILTASGGPFKDFTAAELEKAEPKSAMRHPTWNMGKKISIDSASLANKGLEVIEAYRLFDMPLDAIKVIVHPQSSVHSLIKTSDGALYAQISRPDMRLPIQNALLWPDLVLEKHAELNLEGLALNFEAPDLKRFPLLPLAFEACKKGDPYPIVYNAANEVAVELFCRRRIKFTEMAQVVESALQRDYGVFDNSLPAVLMADNQARKAAMPAG